MNMSSMGGRFTLPGGAFYHASKHAVEAMSDALRFEVAGLGVQVVVIEPGLIRSAFGNTAIGTVEHATDDEDPYATFNQQLMLRIDSAYSGRLNRLASSPPEAVAKVVARALGSSRPRTRYIVTVGARGMLLLRALLPDRAWDAMLRTNYSPPRTP